MTLAPYRAARVLLDARVLAFDEAKHPRDERGRWTDTLESGSDYKKTSQGVATNTASATEAINARTGKLFEATLYRGVSPKEEAKINRIPSQFAVGEYRTPFPEIAATYGEKVVEVPTRLVNPYVFELGEDAYFNELRKEFGTSNPEKITAKLVAQGHDGLIVKNVPANRGEVTMRDSVEIIVFHKFRGARFNPDQARDERGRWTEIGAFSSDVDRALEEISSGREANVERGDVEKFVRRAATMQGPVDLTKLTVDGRPIIPPGTDIPRVNMPQIPGKDKETFFDELRQQGVTVEREDVPPGTLLPTQNQINAVRVGEQMERGMATMPPILVSKDSYVLDGHHRWAARVVLDADKPRAGIRMPVQRLSVDLAKSLELMRSFNQKHGIEARALAEWDESEHPRDDRGQWTAFHGTSVEVAKAIKSKGLKVNTEGQLFVATDEREVLGYALEKAGAFSGGVADKHIAVVVLHKNAQPYFTAHRYGGRAEGNPKWRMSDRDIPPSLIKEVRIYDAAKVENALHNFGKIPKPLKTLESTLKTLQEGTFFVAFVVEELRSRNAARRETALHRAADAHHAKMSVAIRFGFAAGRKALSKTRPNPEAVVAAIRKALGQVLPATLRKVLVAGGEVAADELMNDVGAARLTRHAAFNPDQPRDEQGQWTSTAGAEQIDMMAPIPRRMKPASYAAGFVHFYHVTSIESAKAIDTEGLKASAPNQFQSFESQYDVYGWGNLDRARLEVQRAEENYPGAKSDLAIVHFQVPKAEWGRLRADEDTGQTTSWQESYKTGLSAALVGSVPPEWIIGHFVDKSVRALRSAKRGEQRIGPLAFRFDKANPAAVDWADRHAAELIDGITETTREDISNAIAEGLESGSYEDAYEQVLEAIGDADRAELITANELMTAVHEGQRQAWDQAVDAGLLTGDEKVVWIVTGDDKVCPICESLDGKTRDLGGSYMDGEGEEHDGPPAHVRCRCTEGLA